MRGVGDQAAKRRADVRSRARRDGLIHRDFALSYASDRATSELAAGSARLRCAFGQTFAQTRVIALARD